MAARHREKLTPFPGGGTRHVWNFGVDAGTTVQLASDRQFSAICDDVTGSAGQDHSLLINKWVSAVAPLNGWLPSSTASSRAFYTSWYPTASKVSPSHLALPALSAFDAASFLAKVNPGRHQVETLENLVDFKDLPKLLKLSGDTILKRGAGAYLTWEFGWKPLISDVKKILDFTGRVNKKVAELHKLYESGGVHRRRNVSSDSASSTSNRTLETINAKSVTTKLQIDTTRTRWATTRFVPTSLPPKDDSDYRRKAIQIIFGLDVSPATVWEALPWSWLVDWFSNVGDYLVQYNNVCPVRATSPCLMTMTRSKYTETRTDSFNEVSGGQRLLVYETKVRSIVAPTLEASIPFLTGRQLSILGALFILKHRASK